MKRLSDIGDAIKQIKSSGPDVDYSDEIARIQDQLDRQNALGHRPIDIFYETEKRKISYEDNDLNLRILKLGLDPNTANLSYWALPYCKRMSIDEPCFEDSGIEFRSFAGSETCRDNIGSLLRTIYLRYKLVDDISTQTIMSYPENLELITEIQKAVLAYSIKSYGDAVKK